MVSPVKVKRSVRRYLDYSSLARILLKQTLTHLSDNLPETIIFGGMIREFALGNTRAFSSDIDIVSRATRSEIFKVIKNYEPTQNKFGGYRFLVGKQLFDIWSFEDTWAFREGLIEANSVHDIFKTTFFNIDAAAFNLTTKDLMLSENYIRDLKKGLLDLNLKTNPSPNSMAKRAVRLATQNDLAVSPDLGDYIIEYFDDENSDYITNLFIVELKEFKLKSPDDNFIFRPQSHLFNEFQEHETLAQEFIENFNYILRNED